MPRMPSVIEQPGALVAVPTDTSLISRIPPIFLAFFGHLLALGVVWLVALSVAALGGGLPLIVLAGLEGVFAAWLAYRLGMAAWWIPIQLLFFPAVLVALAVELSPSLFLGLFLVSLTVYWSVYRTQVPLYLSSRLAWEEVAKLLAQGHRGNFIDLGSGVGGLVVYLARLRSDLRCVGVEAAPLPFLAGWLRAWNTACDMRFGSLWDVDLSEYDVAYAYLSPVPMARLWEKVTKEMRPGSLFISNTFAVPGVFATETRQLADFHQSTLYIYRL